MPPTGYSILAIYPYTGRHYRRVPAAVFPLPSVLPQTLPHTLPTLSSEFFVLSLSLIPQQACCLDVGGALVIGVFEQADDA